MEIDGVEVKVGDSIYFHADDIFLPKTLKGKFRRFLRVRFGIEKKPKKGIYIVTNAGNANEEWTLTRKEGANDHI